MKATHFVRLKAAALVLFCIIMIGSVLDIIIFSHKNDIDLSRISLHNAADDAAARVTEKLTDALAGIETAAALFTSESIHSESSLKLLSLVSKSDASGRFWLVDNSGAAVSGDNMRESRPDDTALKAAAGGLTCIGEPVSRDGILYAVVASPVVINGAVQGALICEIPFSELCPASSESVTLLLLSNRDGSYDGGSIGALLGEATFNDSLTLDSLMIFLSSGEALDLGYWIDSSRYIAETIPAGDSGCTVFAYSETSILGSSVSSRPALNIYISVKIVLIIILVIAFLLIRDVQRKAVAALRHKSTRLVRQINEIAQMHSGNVTFEYNSAASRIRIIEDRFNVLDLPDVIGNIPNSLVLLGIVHPNFNETHAELYRKINSGEESAVCELQLRDREGAYRWYRVMLINLRDEKSRSPKALGILIDIDSEKAARHRSFEENRYRYALISSSLFAFRFDLTCKTILSVYASDEARKDFYPPEDYTTESIDKKLIHPDDVINLIRVCGEENLWRAYRTGVSEIKLKARIKNLAGEWVDVNATVRLLSATGGASVRGIAYVEPAAAVPSTAVERIAAQRDELTGFYNRTRAAELVDALMMYPISDDELHALLLVRIAGFSELGEISGEEELNRMLLESAAVINSDIRSTDIIARLSDDSFVIFLKNIKSCDFATGKAEVLCSRLSLISPPRHTDIKIAASAGIVFAPRDGSIFNDLVSKAEGVLSAGGEDSVRIYDGGTQDAD